MRFILAAILAMDAATHAFAQQVPGASDTGIAPAVFGPGVLSSGEVYRGSFAPDGRTFYFFRKVGSGEVYHILRSTWSAGAWSEPRRVDLGGDFSDLYPSISRDGRRMVFTSYRPLPDDTSHNAHVWYADRTGDGWGTPVPFPGNLPGHYHAWTEIGPDGAIYFRRTTPDWRQTQTFVSQPAPGGGYGTPVAYAPVDEARRLRPDLSIAGGSPGPDGTIVFLDVATRDSATGRRASDIWIVSREGAGWSPPKKLDSTINGAEYDVFPFFSPDGKELFFVRAFRTFYRTSLRHVLDAAR
jgi:hypothetical protein